MADRGKVLKGLEWVINDIEENGNINHAGQYLTEIKDALELLKEQEAIVRCKDCKYAYLTSDGECKYCELEKDDNGSLIEMYRSWDWFCADGERRDDDA